MLPYKIGEHHQDYGQLCAESAMRVHGRDESCVGCV